MPPWAGLPAEQYVPGQGRKRPGEARNVVAGLQWPAAGRFGELAGGPPLPGQSTAALTLAPSSGEPPGTGRPQVGPVNQPADHTVLQMLVRQMQQQQEQQMQQQQKQMQQQEMMIRMLQNLGLQSQPAAAPPPHSPPLQPQDGRPGANLCRQCAPRPHCPVSQWVNSESEAARLAAPPEQLFLGEAAAGLP